MALEAIYYIGQTISVIAILGSLIFVGIQVRQGRHQTEQANKLARAELRQAAAMKCLEFQDSWYGSEESSDFMSRALQTDGPLTAADKNRFGIRTISLFTSIEITDRLWRQGLFDQKMYDRMLLVVAAYCAVPRVQKWWHSSGRDFFIMPFQGVVDDAVKRCNE